MVLHRVVRRLSVSGASGLPRGKIKYAWDYPAPSLYPTITSRAQWWKPPERKGPEVAPLSRGPDFSFKDGNRDPVLNYHERKRRLHQMQLGKRIIELLKEVKETEDMHKHAIESEKNSKEEYLKDKPRAKGQQRLKSS